MVIDQLNSILMIHDDDSSEVLISKYILDHSHDILDLKANCMIKEIGISKSTLHRFCKLVGLNNFTELQYQCYLEVSQKDKQMFKCKCEDQYKDIYELFKNKKRIIILGDDRSIAPLMCYKQLFEKKQIQFALKLNVHDHLKILKDYHLNKDDIVVYCSLFVNNVELHNSMFNSYLKMIEYLEENSITWIYMGKSTYKNEKEKKVVAINTGQPSEQIYKLCTFFENIYACL